MKAFSLDFCVMFSVRYLCVLRFVASAYTKGLNDILKEEKAIMDSLARNYDVKVQMLPEINMPSRTRMADSLIIWRNGIKEK